MHQLADSTATGPSELRLWREWLLSADVRSIHAYWNDLPPDPYVTTGERLRRYAVARYQDGRLQVLPEEPHVQALAHNQIFGGVERTLAPIKSRFFDEPAVGHILTEVLTSVPVARRCWRLQFHQFRILAPGAPTPEGLHRDGAKYVLMVMMRRHRVDGGVTSLYGMKDGEPLAHLLLTQPGQALLVDDERIRHCVSRIEPRVVDGNAAYRDMLIVTFHDDGDD